MTNQTSREKLEEAFLRWVRDSSFPSGKDWTVFVGAGDQLHEAAIRYRDWMEALLDARIKDLENVKDRLKDAEGIITGLEDNLAQSEGRVKELEAEIERYKKNENELETLIRLDLETEFSVEAERFDKDCKKALWRLADSMDFPWADGEEYTAVEIEEWLEEYIRGLEMAIESKIEKLNGKEVDDGK